MKTYPDAPLVAGAKTSLPFVITTEPSCRPLLSSVIYLLFARLSPTRISRADLYLSISVFLLCYVCRLSYQVQPGRFIVSVLKTWFLITLILASIGLTNDLFDYFDPEVLLAWVIVTPLATITLHLLMPATKSAVRTFFPKQTVIVIGASEIGQHLASLVENGKSMRQEFVGFFDDRHPERANIDNGNTVLLGNIDSAPDYVRAHQIDMVYIALPMASQARILQLLDGLQDTTATIKFVPDIFSAKPIQAKVENIFGVTVISVYASPPMGIQGFAKRGLDLFLCLCVLPLVLPLMAIIAMLIRLTSSGPIFFKQQRYGLHGEKILVWKFRTMHVLEDGDATYQQVTRNDTRITTVGNLLRKTSLDELPQIFNVLLGSMSLVGPRPHAIAVNEEYRQRIAGYMMRHKVKPGITGLAQVNGCRGGDDIESMSRRVEFDLAYLRLWSIGLDIEILLHTVFLMIRGDKAAF